MGTSVSNVTDRLPLETALRFENQWVELRKLIYKDIKCNSILPLHYLWEMVALGLPITGSGINYYAMASFVGALFDSNPDKILLRLSMLRIISYYWPALSSDERKVMLTNLTSFLALLNYAT